MGYITAARVAALAKDEQRALDLLDQLFAVGQARRLPRLCIASIGERMRLHAQRGRGDVCAVVAKKLDSVLAGLESHEWGLLGPVVDLQANLARTYAAVGRQQWRVALELCGEALPQAERLRRGRDAVQLYLLRALATDRCGQDASQLLQGGLSTARMWGLARIVVDTHAELPALVQRSGGEPDPAPSRRRP